MNTDDHAPTNRWLDERPPWLVFPRMKPMEVAATQGLEEAWVDQVWRPFWAGLSTGQRAIYLDHWQATRDWRDALRLVFEVPADFDVEADAAESQAWLAERRDEGSPAAGVKGWLDRFRRRR